MDASSKSVSRDDESGIRRHRPLAEKLRILEEAARPGASVAAVARGHGLNANLVFAWRRLHQKGLLEGQRHVAPPLLPVTITAPTITPTQRAASAAPLSPKPAATPAPTSSSTSVEILLPGGVRVHLHGEAQRAVLERVLALLPRS